jgi:hypothetical protein
MFICQFKVKVAGVKAHLEQLPHQVLKIKQLFSSGVVLLPVL